MRKSARYTGAATVMAAALLVSGCGSGGDDGDAKPGSGPTAQEPTEPPAEESTTGGIDGTWTSKGSDGPLVLSISGDQAALLGQSACAGKVTPQTDPVTITLKCSDGSTTRTRGTVGTGDGKLTVSWSGGATETFSKAETPSDIPSGLSDLPTDPGDLTPQ